VSLNEPGEDSSPPGPQSTQIRNPAAEGPKNEGQAPQPLRVNVTRANAPDESLSVNLGETDHPDEVASQVQVTLDLSKGTRVRVAVESLTPAPKPSGIGASSGAKVIIESQGDDSEPIITLESATKRTPGRTRIRTAIQRYPYSLEFTLFGLALLVYLATHLIGLTRFPIYFFSDEAVQTVTAAALTRDHFLAEGDIFLPTYFKNGPYYNLSVSVYLQVLPSLIFGKSVFVTRAVSVLMSLLAAVSIGLILRDIFKISYWWAGVSLLSIVPAWFLHSRTAFETVLFVSFYAACLYTYLLYRYRSPRYLYYAILFGALAFYSYSPGQVVIGVTGVLLLISDARYHWQNRVAILSGLGLGLLLALPYLRFRINHPSAPFEQLRILNSYWLQPLPIQEKLARFWSEYLYGLSPGYWFIPNQRDLPRHLMKGYGHISLLFLPFAVLGLYLTIRGIKSSAFRVLLIALLAAPVGAALVQIGITRTLAFVIPATLLIALGMNQVLSWLERARLPRRFLAIGLFIVLTTTNILMLRDVLTNAPTWYQDYGLGGLQYGAQQLFPEIEAYLESNPGEKIILSPNWANGTDVVARFFLGDPLPIKMGSIDGHLFQHLPLDSKTIFVMMPNEYQQAIESGKFKDAHIEKTLPYPNGEPGFYFTRLNYMDEIDLILERERQQRSILRSAVVELNGEPVQVKHSMLDMGEASHMFDGDPHTLGRTLEANPAEIELTFSEPRSISGLSVIIGSTEAEIRVQLFRSLDSEPIEYLETLRGTVEQPAVSLAFAETTLAQAIRLEIRDLHQSEPGNVHIWEIIFQE
jgi:4-amino-4-deoxy-L-arabinose transferase-like glycosyltransferase